MEMDIARRCWAVLSLISCVVWLVMGSRANTIAYATRVMPHRRSESGADLRSALVQSIAAGVKIAMEQCKDDFKWERWNCPDFEFSRRYEMGSTREMAYVSSITAAGITYSVARACAKGNLDIVGCHCLKRTDVDTQVENVEGASTSTWEWENCDSDLKTGQLVSEVFLKHLEEGAEDIKAQANLHNFKLGRKSVERRSGEECKCHGLSGSCTTKTCWGRVAPFVLVGKHLKEKYHRALRVAANRHVPRALTQGHDAEMVFLEESPDYCKANISSGWRGTEGRVCSRRKGPETERSEKRSCRELCRSCGHQVRRRTVKTYLRCNCTFHWCCNVTCSTCTKVHDESYCDATPSSLVRRRKRSFVYPL